MVPLFKYTTNFTAKEDLKGTGTYRLLKSNIFKPNYIHFDSYQGDLDLPYIFPTLFIFVPEVHGYTFVMVCLCMQCLDLKYSQCVCVCVCVQYMIKDGKTQIGDQLHFIFMV